jgi:hypothetical protein
MNTKPRSQSDRPRKDRAGAPESPASNDTFSHRTKKPGEAGLANEARPGLGTRGRKPAAPPPDRKSREGGSVADRQRSSREPNDQPLPREPKEQQPDSFAQQEERDTRVSGHAGND